MRMKPITISKGCITCSRNKKKKKKGISQFPSKPTYMQAHCTTCKSNLRKKRGFYSINEVLLRWGLRNEASLEVKSPYKYKNCNYTSWESGKKQNRKWWKQDSGHSFKLLLIFQSTFIVSGFSMASKKEKATDTIMLNFYCQSGGNN